MPNGTYMGRQVTSFKSSLQPTPKVLVSCRNQKGEDNALAVAYCCNCSYDPPMLMVGIVPSRYSYDMIKEAGTFVVNLPSKQNALLFEYLGKNSRRDGDKLTAAGAKVSEAITINAPVLKDCPVNIECQIVDSIRTGSHEMFVGKILYIHADESLIDESGCINYSAADLL